MPLEVFEDLTVGGLIDLTDTNVMSVLQHDTTNQKTKFRLYAEALCADSPLMEGWIPDAECRKSSGALDFGEILKRILYYLMKKQSPFNPS